MDMAHWRHNLRAPLVEEPEKVAAVEAPDVAGTPARGRCSVQVVPGPRVAREEALEPCVAQQGVSGAPGPRVARRGVPGAPGPRPRQVRRMAPEQRVVQEEAQAPP
jgi:hypothetical protein